MGAPSNEYGDVPGGPGIGFCSPGGDFSGNKLSGKPLQLLKLKAAPGTAKTSTRTTRTTPVLIISPPGTIKFIERLRVVSQNGRFLNFWRFAFCGLRFAFRNGRRKTSKKHTHTHIYIYIYIEREREREGERERERERLLEKAGLRPTVGQQGHDICIYIYIERERYVYTYTYIYIYYITLYIYIH